MKRRSFAQESRDLRDRELMLLSVEQEVAAFAGREEVRIFRDVLQRLAVIAGENLLATVPDVIGAAAVAALGDKAAREADVGPRDGAVETNMHEAARLQQ